MHRIGHHITGALTGLGVGMHLSSQDGAGFSVLGISVLGGWYGGVFPDAFEKIWGMYWIQHRTVTHWVPLLSLIQSPSPRDKRQSRMPSSA